MLLIDELDRADEPFEAYLLEVLADFQITIPELGTITASEPPIVVITSNRTREIHDAIKRRCYYHWVDYPDAGRELEILRVRAPGTPEALSREVVAFVQGLRGMDLFKVPGVAETIDWAQALTQLDVLALSPDVVNDTLGSLLKYQDDIARIRGSEAANVIEQIKRELRIAGRRLNPPVPRRRRPERRGSPPAAPAARSRFRAASPPTSCTSRAPCGRRASRWEAGRCSTRCGPSRR